MYSGSIFPLCPTPRIYGGRHNSLPKTPRPRDCSESAPFILPRASQVPGCGFCVFWSLDLGLNPFKTPEEIQKNVINKGGFYVDLREFMPSSAGPFAPGYTDRPPHMMTGCKGRADEHQHRQGDSRIYRADVQSQHDRQKRAHQRVRRLR